MYEEIFMDIGMTKSETAVYLALLEIGSSTTGPIIKRAGIASGKAYLILDKLIQKGLVTYTIQSGTKHYQAKDPETLIDYFKMKQNELMKKEQKLQKIVKNLKIKYNEKISHPITEIYEGINGIKSFYNFVLNDLKKYGGELKILGVPKDAMEQFDEFFIGWNKERIKKKINVKIIYNHDAKNYGEKRRDIWLY
ncbi:MAG: hypothetical protein KJ559_03305 [Nanoarchaeota archaeon]|nr:hypothetical protein [Nanoarchaeota archaeon]